METKTKNGKRTSNPICCPLLWDFTDRKHCHNRENPQNSRSAEGDPKEIH